MDLPRQREYVLYEDDGVSTAYKDGAFVKTHMSITLSGNEAVFTVMPAGGDTALLPKGRRIYLNFRDIVSARVEADGEDRGELKKGLFIEYTGVPVVVTLRDCVFTCNADYRESVVDVVSRYNMRNARKKQMFMGALDSLTSGLHAPKALKGPIEELRRICTFRR